MAKQYLDVTFRISADDLSLVIQTLASVGSLTKVSVVGEPTVPRKSRARGGTTADELLIEVMGKSATTRKFSRHELGSIFAAKGFNEATASPALSRAKKRGFVVCVEPGMYSRTGDMPS